MPSQSASVQLMPSAKRRTYTVLRSWVGFDGEMTSLLEGLDDTRRLFQGFALPGAASRTTFMPAADEGEVRGPMSFVCLIPNDVAKHMGLDTELVGGGSNRSLSCTDWVVRKRPTDDVPAQPGRPDPKCERLGQQELADKVLGCVEVKGDWQWDLKEGEDPAGLPVERQAALKPALQQIYGDMVGSLGGVLRRVHMPSYVHNRIRWFSEGSTAVHSCCVPMPMLIVSVYWCVQPRTCSRAPTFTKVHALDLTVVRCFCCAGRAAGDGRGGGGHDHVPQCNSAGEAGVQRSRQDTGHQPWDRARPDVARLPATAAAGASTARLEGSPVT